MISYRAKNVGLKELEIFDKFIIDKKLPKYKKDNEGNSISGGFVIETDNVAMGSNLTSWGNDGSVEVSSFSTIINFIKNLFNKIFGKIQERKHYDTILDFFNDFEGKVQDIKVIDEMADYYEKALMTARESGQEALAEKITHLMDVLKYETLLYAMRITKFVTEEQIYDFYVKVNENKALQLTWIKNFARVIPSDILELKKKVDEKKIFDNYVILHYDKDGSGSAMTKKEKEMKKDPILFGVIAKSKKLYYIADWKDEVCDLTLDKMFEELGENVLKINNKSVKTYIDTGEDNRRRSFKRKK